MVVLGAGAAGLFCAAVAGQRGRRVLVLEHNDVAGRKILISGGGHANFTHLNAGPSHFLSENPHFAKSALARFTPRDFLGLVHKHGIAYREKAPGQLFCQGSAREIVSLLLAECRAGGVHLRTGCRVDEVGRDDLFSIATSQGRFGSQALVVATGGLSIPSLGASDLGYRLARRFGLSVETPRPALVPLVLGGSEGEALGPLAGVAFEVEVRCGSARFRDRALVTHRGLSGPAILQVSSYWQAGTPVTLDLLPGADIARRLCDERERGSRAEFKTLLAEAMPKRLAEWWCRRQGLARPICQLSDREIGRLAEGLHAWRIVPEATEGFAKAEVTAGGVSTAELSSKTMEARRVPGLYFIGEVVDVTGWLGGFNFQWAWSSAHAAGEGV
ncbi:MAG TPA: NAD(P)/FAD-dependent oxidoreductase [Vicinamibacteria bacterium]|nr:NAD(P)/FAD-dependent oxidoreductase [Vicinamibacteria bacterium]